MPTRFAFVAALLLLWAPAAWSQTFQTGDPVLTDIWVDPSGNDANSGATRAEALRTLAAAWQRVPAEEELTAGYRILLGAGTYPQSAIPSYLESRYGTWEAPIVIQAADAPRSARLAGGLNVYDTQSLYLIGLSIVPDPAGDVFHCEQCSSVLIRDCLLDGGGAAQETIKANQSEYIFVEDSTVRGAWDNALDYVAVQYGHVARNDISGAQDWCAYVKGGSSYITIAANEIHGCGTGGFTAGQGSGFQFMVAPWLHYEAYGISVVNNVIHDTEGAGLGVNGGYDVLLAHNTTYRTGTRSHLLEVVFGGRSCDGAEGDPTRDLCAQYQALGGWGPTNVGDGNNYARIPNRHVYVFDNVFYNPAGTVSPQHFTIAGLYDGPWQAGTNAPFPAYADDDLRIEGNVVWNGGPDTPLGLGASSGCGPANPTCNETLLRARNAINAFEPQMVDPAHGDFRPLPGGNLALYAAAPIPPFTWDDLPPAPAVPPGASANDVTVDRNGAARGDTPTAGAYQATAVNSARRRAVRRTQD